MASKSQSVSPESSSVPQGVDIADDELVSDTPPFSFKVLDHAPATSHGTYLEGIRDDFEPLEQYQNGGYHPIHIGDVLGESGRYRVIHKLGHGGYGTVWLCRDTVDPGYVAVKVMLADVTRERFQDLNLTRLDRTQPGAEYVVTPLDSFSITGPNGTHQCIVLPVLGPCVSPRLWFMLRKDPGPVLRGMAHQAALAMNFLHQNGICHGDFRPANILVKLTNLNHLSEDELLSLLGQPEKACIRTESGEDLPASSPEYLTLPADTSRLGDEYLTDQICVIDFGECFSISSPPEFLGIPENYLPPEALLEQENAIGPGCDLWALGCTLFEIREQIPLFYMIYDEDELLAEMVRFFGKLPQPWWDQWEARDDFFDEHGRFIRFGDNAADWSLEVALSKPVEIVKPGRNCIGPPRALITPEAEQRLMADLLHRLFCYEAEKRPSVEEVLEHGWFKM